MSDENLSSSVVDEAAAVVVAPAAVDHQPEKLSKHEISILWNARFPSSSAVGLFDECDVCRETTVNLIFPCVVQIRDVKFFVCRKCSGNMKKNKLKCLSISDPRLRLWLARFGLKHDMMCPVCQEQSIKILDSWHIAHIQAKKHSHEDSIENTIPSCASCNLSMHTQNLLIFKTKINKKCKTKNISHIDALDVVSDIQVNHMIKLLKI